MTLIEKGVEIKMADLFSLKAPLITTLFYFAFKILYRYAMAWSSIILLQAIAYRYNIFNTE